MFQEIQNLSQLLLSLQNTNVVLGFEILKNHTAQIALWNKELVLIWQLHQVTSFKAQAKDILEKHNSQEQLSQWEKDFKLFHQISKITKYSKVVQELLEEHEKIRPHYQDLIALNSDFCISYYKVAERLHLDYNKHLDLAEVYYRIVLKTNPNHKGNLFDFARLLSTSPKGYDQAIKLYLKSAELNPKSAMTMNNIGVIYTHKQEYPKAYTYFKKALVIDSNLILALSNLSKLCTYDLPDQSYQEEAKLILKRLTQIEPHNGAHWDNWAVYFWLIEKNYDKAKEAYKKGLTLDPKNSSLLGNLGELYIDIYGEYHKGLQCYRKALKIEVSSYRLMTTITALVHHADDDTEALEYYKKLVKISPSNQITRDADFTAKQWQDFLSAEKLLFPNN